LTLLVVDVRSLATARENARLRAELATLHGEIMPVGACEVSRACVATPDRAPMDSDAAEPADAPR
jgi:hypothetical protein